MASNEVLLVLLPEYADWEPAIFAPGLRRGFGMWEPRYVVKTVGPDFDPVSSIGGFRITPDYSIDTAPRDFAALILIGGTNWWGDAAQRVLPLARRAVERGAVLGGICDASMFLGVHGFLNDAHHTSNNLAALKARAGAAYTGEARYHADKQSVWDPEAKIVTANGAGFIEFAKNVFIALEAAPVETIDKVCDAFRSGFFPES